MSTLLLSSIQLPLAFLNLLGIWEQNGKGVAELKSSAIVNKLEKAANIGSTWQMV